MTERTKMSIAQIAKMALTDFSSLPPGVRHTLQVWLVTILFGIHVSWACGWIPGMSGFAFAQDVNDVKHEIIELTAELRQQRLDYVEERILAAYAEHCRADARDLKQIHQRRLQRLLRLYQDVTGRNYPLQQCTT